MNLQHLYYFQTLAQLQHFAKSATELYISQPTLSYAISSLEKELNVKLFDRTSRYSQLTPAGRIFLAHVNTALAELESGKKAVQAIESYNQSAFRMITEKTFIAAVILRSFRSVETYQNAKFSLTQMKGPRLYQELYSGNCDFLLSTVFPNMAGIEYFEMEDLPLVFLVNREHPYAEYDSIDLNEVDWSQPLVVRTGSNIVTVKRINQVYKQVGVDPSKAACQVGSSIAMATMVDIGVGFGITAYFPQLEKLENVKVLQISAPKVSSTLYFSRVADTPKPELHNAFFDYVYQHYATDERKTS